MSTRDPRELARRALVLQGSAAAAALAALRFPALAQALGRAFPGRPGEEVLPWADQPPPNPVPESTGNLLRWEQLDAYLTPNDRFFYAQHDGRPAVDAQTWRLVKRQLEWLWHTLRARARLADARSVAVAG
jgi:DMSO/TMAO reductase YedYZ molybdopterin-dependent catalytic subunit